MLGDDDFTFSSEGDTFDFDRTNTFHAEEIIHYHVGTESISELDMHKKISTSSANLIFATDGDSIVYANPAFKNFLGIKSDKNIGELGYINNIYELFIENDDFLHIGKVKYNNKKLSFHDFYLEWKSTPQGKRVVAMLNSNYQPRSFKIDISQLNQLSNVYVVYLNDVTDINSELLELKEMLKDNDRYIENSMGVFLKSLKRLLNIEFSKRAQINVSKDIKIGQVQKKHVIVDIHTADTIE